MNEFVLIHYKPGVRLGLHYWALGAEQHPSMTLAHGRLDELASVCRGKKVYVLIDAHYITLDKVTVPSKNRNKQLQAIPFAMEDQLAVDIEDTHFALGQSSANDELAIPVIAIQRQLLQQTLDLFQQHNIRIDAITADSIAIPGSELQWGILLDEDSALIKMSDSQAHCCDRDNLTTVLQALLDQATTTPESILYRYKHNDTEADSFTASLNLEGQGINIEALPYQNHNLEVFVEHIQKIKQLNLLQGAFTPQKSSKFTWLKPWKPVAILATLWMSLQLTYAGIMSHQLEQKNLLLSQQIEQTFKRAMPEARSMTGIQVRIERKLKELKTGSAKNTDSGFLQLLSKASDTLSSNPNIEIQATVYRNQYIDIDMTAKTLQDIEKLKNKLDTLPGIKTVLSTTVEKNKVQGRLRLEANG